ncbi:acyltransferase domain-containing protein [Lacrimispora sp. 38-1]|uniref:acyltransferase domain-containing protein n=1 Tax=Lacrimispora sp. 38-1 TaxID=3125778 RepID=UPI003CF794A6
MAQKNIFIFSGQGTQYYQMGMELYNSNEVFHKWVDRLDKIAEKELHISIVDIISHGKKGTPFSNLLITHPSIYIIEMALAQTLLSRGIKPDYVFGSSLGEFTAMAIAGVLGIEESLYCIISQAKIIESCCPKGGMLLIADYPDKLDDYIVSPDLSIGVVNNSQNFIVSGYIEPIERLEKKLKDNDILCLRLDIEYGFHSFAIDMAKEKIISLYKNINFKKPLIPYYSSNSKIERNTFDAYYCWDILRNPINTAAAITDFLTRSGFYYIDLSPVDTIANLIKQTDKHLTTLSCLTPFGNESTRLSNMINILDKQVL